MHINEIVRQNIRNRQLNKRMIGKEMAALLEMTSANYSNLIRGKHSFSVYHIWLLAKACDIDPGEFFKPPIQP